MLVDICRGMSPSTSAFPEYWFPPLACSAATYSARVAAGKKRMRGWRAAICGLARDVGMILPKTIARVETTGELFRDYRVFIYENDSLDDTAEQLLCWQDRNRKVTVLCERHGNKRFPQIASTTRSTYLARYRNEYLCACREDPLGFDVLIVLDTDLLGGWSLEGLCHSFSFKGWDVIGSQGLFYRGGRRSALVQFDAWAFRAAGRSEPHHYAEVNQQLWARGSDLVQVWSVFGGMAVYWFESMKAASYSGEDCEHVMLHKAMRSGGHDRIFLNPSQITLYNDIPPDLRSCGPYSRPATLGG
jgi:hypothetical protein